MQISVLKHLADETDLAILQLLKVEATYPRRLAARLGKKEQNIVPRLKSMERAGLLRASWRRVEDKNVRLYEANLDKVELTIGVNGLELVLRSAAGEQSLAPPFYTPPKFDDDPFFVGRRKELELLHSGSNFVVLEGIAGMGKTSLLQEFVQGIRTDSAVFWHTFKETDSFNYVVTRLATFLEQRESVNLLEYIRGRGKDDSAKLDLLVRGLDKEGTIAVFDDYHNERDEKLESMLRYLQSNLSKAKIIVASRTRPNFLVNTPNLLEVRLEGLSKTEGIHLMRERDVKLKDEQLAVFHQRTSGHPLALMLLSTILAKEPQRSKDLRRELPTGVLVDELLGSLREEERSLLLMLSVFRNPIPSEGIVHISKLRGTRYLLQSLQRRMLLKRNKDSFLLHEMVREGCYGLVDFPQQLHRRIGEWYLGRKGTQEVLESLYHLSRAEDWIKIGEILSEEFFDERFQLVELGLSSSVLEILESVKTDGITPKPAISVLCVKARALAEAQEWGRMRASLNLARNLAKRIDDPMVTGCLFLNIGRCDVVRGDILKAEANFLNSMNHLRKAQDREKLRKLNLEMAKLSFVQGDLAKAMQYASAKVN